MILAIHYRKSDEANNTAPGMWKEFTGKNAALEWLQVRLTKTNDSPKGWIIIESANVEVITKMIEHGKDIMPVSCKKALENYLKWKKY